MLETINDRIEMLINDKFSGNKSAFAKSIGLGPTGMSSYVSKQRRSKPSVDMVTKIVTKLNVDAHWLLTGEGDMFNTSSHGQSSTAPDADITANSSEIDKTLIEKLTSENELLNKLLDEKERFINHLLASGTSK